jgi:hypothetical protein
MATKRMSSQLKMKWLKIVRLAWVATQKSNSLKINRIIVVHTLWIAGVILLIWPRTEIAGN